MPDHSTPRQRVEHGLDTIPQERSVTVPLRDLMYVHQTLGELVQFFHQPMHYPDLQAVERFLGTRNSGGGIDVLFEAFYKKMGAMAPPDIGEAFSDGERFEHPLPPNYYDSHEDDGG
jgi:hypothetical protein